MLNGIREFLKLEASAGILLGGAALVALVWSNSPFGPLYDAFLATPVSLIFGALEIAKPLRLWINDGLMAVFFFMVGLEIKREVLAGELSTLRKASLPVIAAAGGMIVPALIYLAINRAEPANLDGWAIPTATDIAFALGVFALLAGRVPIALKIFLLALAIIDDLGAIVIIAAWYTSDLSLASLSVATGAFLVLVALNRGGVTRTAPYVLVGVVLWVSVLKSGVHATLAGVILALTVPLHDPADASVSPLRHLEAILHPWVAFAILPMFALANAGVSLSGMSLASLLAPLPLGIAAGLFLGKQIGVFLFSWAAVRVGLARLPEGVNWAQMYGMALLTGIGFTMSLFIGTLAFDDPALSATVRVGVLCGSIVAAIAGFAVLRFLPQRESGYERVRVGGVARVEADG